MRRNCLVKPKAAGTILAMDESPQTKKKIPFVAIEKASDKEKKHVVMRGSEFVCIAVSRTMARRIANALNRHVPNERGE